MRERGLERVGKYRIDDVLGEGAMGVVYRDRFAREAKAAGRCMHPNLVTVFD